MMPWALGRTFLGAPVPYLYGEQLQHPLEAKLPSPFPAPNSNELGRWDPDQPRRRAILLVDDEALVVNVGKYILEDAGYRVIVAGSGEEALDIYTRQGHEIDLVILDYVMPGINGFQTWQKLAEMKPDIRVLFWSGYLADTEVSRLIADKSCDFIAKPYQIPDLLAKIGRMLGQEAA